MITKSHERALALLEDAIGLMDDAGDTLVAAHIAIPIDILQRRLNLRHGTTPDAAA